MKKLILSFCFFFLFLSTVFAEDYSFFVEEDSKSVMIIYYNQKGFNGEIISFGGYDWFRRTYSNPSELVATYIQPSKFGISGNMESYMQERYLINNFQHSFRIQNDDHILTFRSKNAFQNIMGYLTRNEEFSFASLAEETWYAGTFSPMKEIDDLIELANQNQMTFCMLLDFIEKIDGRNVNLKTSNVRGLMSEIGLNCNNNFLLK